MIKFIRKWLGYYIIFSITANKIVILHCRIYGKINRSFVHVFIERTCEVMKATSDLLGKAWRQRTTLMAVEPGHFLPQNGMEKLLAHLMNLPLASGCPTANLQISMNFHLRDISPNKSTATEFQQTILNLTFICSCNIILKTFNTFNTNFYLFTVVIYHVSMNQTKEHGCDVQAMVFLRWFGYCTWMHADNNTTHPM